MTQAAVNRLQAVPGGSGAEVARLDQRDGQPSLGRVPGGGGAVDAPAHDEQVVLAGRERRQVPLHRITARRTSAARSQSSLETPRCVTSRKVTASMAEARTPWRSSSATTSGAVRPSIRPTTMFVRTGATRTPRAP